MTVTNILEACVTGPYAIEYQHPASDRWVPLTRHYDDFHDAVEQGKKVVNHKARVVTTEGRVVWTS